MSPGPHTDELDLVADLVADDELRVLVDDLRSIYAFGPPPEMGAHLATVLAKGLAGGAVLDEHLAAPPAPAIETRQRRPLTDRLQGRRVRLALGMAVASLTVFGTGAVGALPGPVQSVFEQTVEVVGIDLPETTRTTPPAPAPAPAEAPTTSPNGDVGTERPSPAPAEPERPSGQNGSSPFDPPTPGPPADRPSQGDTGAPGRETSRDGRADLPDGLPAPATPGQPENRPGSGPPAGIPTPDDDGADDDGADGDAEDRERSGPPDGTPAATGRAAEPPSGSGQPPANGPAVPRGLR